MTRPPLLNRREFAALLGGASSSFSAAPAASPWNLRELSAPPATYPAEGFDERGVKAVFFDGQEWEGRPTRVFAYYGLPENRGKGKVPGMVLVHGGGGTAFADWVRIWTARGYAAIAMDTCGSVPRGKRGAWERHPYSGPAGWGGLKQIDSPVKDQWPYHAAAAVIRAHSLLRSFPGVDASRIGIEGFSWGGYLTAIVAGTDSRFRFAIPVWGCGFLEESAWAAEFARMGEERSRRWLDLWDPSHHVVRARMPILWISGTNDFAYPLPSLQKTYRLPRARRTLAIRVRMPHSQDAGTKAQEAYPFADSFCLGKPPLVRIRSSRVRGSELTATFDAKVPVEKAELNFTRDSVGDWKGRLWESVPARLGGRTVSAAAPPGARVAYLNLFDRRGMAVSTEHTLLPAGAPPATVEPLFNGKDLSGWARIPRFPTSPGNEKPGFEVRDGLIATVAGAPSDDIWYTRRKIGNATLLVVYKVSDKAANSGVFIRIPIEPKSEDDAIDKGIEVQIFEPGDEFHCSGVFYSMTKALSRPYKPAGEWNTMLIAMRGARTVVRLNHVVVMDYDGVAPVPPKRGRYEPERGPRPESGYIAIQHHGGPATVWFKEISLIGA